MKYFIYAALIPPLLVILFGLAAKWYFATYVRMEVIAPRIQPLPPSHLRTLYKASKLLCVGCTSGIGLAAATAACEAGAFVVVVGRRKPEEMLEVCKKPVEFVKGDLSVMRNVKTVTERIASYAFDTVLFTIGTVSSPKRKATEEGIEMDMAVSLLSRFVMARLLTSSKNQTLKAISPARKARIFIMGFSGGTAVPQLTDFNWEDKNTTFAPWKAHENTVIGNDALVEKLAKFHPSINVYGLNPGIIKTDILAPLLGGTKSYAAKAQELLLTHVCPSVEEYVNGTLKHLLVTPEIENYSGSYFNQMGERIKGSTWLAADPGNTDLILAEAGKLANKALSYKKAILSPVLLYKYVNGKIDGGVELISK